MLCNLHTVCVILLVISVQCGEIFEYPSDIIAKGYQFESIEVTTQDDYIIDLHHFHTKQTDAKKVLLLIHGVTQNSQHFFKNDAGLEHSMGYYYLAKNYDVWLFNARGNLYSRKHKHFDVTSSDFWSFDWNEVGLYDLSITIDVIQNKTNRNQISAVCFSLGCTELFILLSENDVYNDKIEQVHAMAPSVYLHLFSKAFFTDILKQYLMAASHYIDIFGDHETTAVVSYFYKRVCPKSETDSLYRKCVKQVLKMMEYKLPGLYNRFKFYLSPEPTGSPIKFLTHFFQISESKRFQKYDYGTIRNLFVYKTIVVPDYNLTRIRAPVYLYNSMNDELLDTNYFGVLHDRLGNTRHSHVINMTGFQHNAFVRHKEAGQMVYKLIDYFINL